MQIVPLQVLPSQAITVTLNGQKCQINVYQKRTGLFLDLYLAGTLIVAGALCLDRNPVVRSVYLGFVGDLMFFDTQGTDDPSYSSVGSRFILAYLVAADVS